MFEFEAKLDEVPFLKTYENFNAILNTAFRGFSQGVVARSKEWIVPTKSGLNNRTGNLRDSIRLAKFSQFSPNSGATAVITAGNSRVPYSAIHEYGGVIRPTKGQYLTFQVSGRFVSVRQVTIPARPYLAPAFKEMIPEFDNYLQDALDRIVGKL